jgi:hypothetical protein
LPPRKLSWARPFFSLPASSFALPASAFALPASVFALSAPVIVLIGILVSNSTMAAYNFYYKLSTLSQDVAYLQTSLTEILQPAGYELLPATISVGDVIGSPATAQTSVGGNVSYPLLGSNVQNDKYALRVVQFSALSEQRIFSGWIYLVIARTDANEQPLVQLKSQSQKGFSEIWKRAYWHSLTKDENPLSFQLEVRASNLHLKAGLAVPNSELPVWAQARPHFPKATSSQIVEYSQRRISQILEPMGFQLTPSSVDISESVVVGSGPGFPPSLRVVEGATHALRGLQFRAKNSTGKTFSGGITLVISNPEASHLQPNSSSEPLQNPLGSLKASIFLSNDVDQNSFPLDIRFQNLRLAPVFTGFH